MDSAPKKPRVNASMLPRHHGSVVCLLGIAHSVNPNGTSFQLTTSDKQNINIQMQEPLNESLHGLTEIHGTVQQNNSILCQNYVVLPQENPDSFDMESYNKAVILMNQYPEHYVVGAPA